MVLFIPFFFFFFFRGTSPSRPRYADFYGDEDLSVEQKLFPSGLGTSLKRAMSDVQVHPIQNIFFLLNGLTDSDTALVGLGCQMHAAKEGATVHFIVLGGGRTSIAEYRTINQFGIDHCQAYFHDARPLSSLQQQPEKPHVYASYAANAISFIVKVHHPKAFIYTHSKSLPKPNWFLAALDPHKHTTTHIALPKDSLQRLGWMARLSPTSLNAWNKPRIDLIVQTSRNTASLDRLLKNFLSATYPTSEFPNLLIVYDDASIESARSLATELSTTWHPDKLSIHRHLQPHQESMLETWYPINDNHYALFVGDEWELSPYFYGYLRWMILKYQYDVKRRYDHRRVKLLGMSLNPTPPTPRNAHHKAEKKVKEGEAEEEEVEEDGRGMPVLRHGVNLSFPFLFFPVPFEAFHEFKALQNDLASASTSASASPDSLDISIRSFVEHQKWVVMHPPLFQYDHGDYVLAKHHPVPGVRDMSDPPRTLHVEDRVGVLDSEIWWRKMGNDRGVMPDWGEIKVLLEQGEEVTDVNDFFTQEGGHE